MSLGKRALTKVAYTAIMLFLVFSVCTFENIPVLSVTFSVTGGCDEPVLEWEGDLTHTQSDDIDVSPDGPESSFLRDFIAEATFQNPYSSDEGKWDYGFLIKISQDIYYAIRITSDDEWDHIQLTGEGERISLNQGKVDLQLGAKQSNDLRIIVVGDSGALYVNGQFVTELDTSGLTKSGEVRVGTGINRNYKIAGKVTECKNFRVWSLDTPSKGPLSGSLEDTKDGSIESFSADISVRDFIVEATFYNPYSSGEGKWDYGFLFRRSKDGKMYGICVTSDGEWSYDLITGEKKENIGFNKLDVRTGANQANHLRLIVIGEEGWFFVNEEVMPLSVDGLTGIGNIDIATGIISENEIEGKSTRYEGFTVWSLDGCPQLPVYEVLDKDRDRVPDDKDSCYNPECSIVNENGCPKDTDEDGLNDCDDDCSSEFGYPDNNGCPVDSDNDEVKDDKDRCFNPNCTNVDKNGCPIDSDNDDVNDCDDKCPSVYGERTYDGCPDTDNDRVIDDEDDCPDSKCDTVDEKGCPIDSDSDDVSDCEDECPSQKGLAFNNGCPLPLYLYMISLVVLAAILIIGVLQKKRKGEEKESEKSEKPRKATCPFCKNELEEDWISCPHCGIKIKEDTQTY
jgi:hypothetical protein